MERLNGENGMITRVCKGIGKAISLGLASEGVNIVLSYIELFEEDPLEMSNLIEDKRLQTTLSELEKEFQILIKQTNDPAILTAPDFGLYTEVDRLN